MNKYLSIAMKTWYLHGFDFNVIGLANDNVDVAKTSAIWAVGLTLIVAMIVAFLGFVLVSHTLGHLPNHCSMLR